MSTTRSATEGSVKVPGPEGTRPRSDRQLLAWWLAGLVVVLWPFCVYWRYVYPLDDGYRFIGNDFDYLYYNYKLYLLAALSRGYFPLWSPAEGAGFPFYSSPFPASFYPLNALLLLVYLGMGGYTHLDHQIFTVAGISLFGLGAFFWLRRLGLPLRAIVAATMLSALSFRLAEVTRFPNAVHAVAWYPWILYSVSTVLVDDSRRARWFGLLVLVWALICLCTAGYPYYAYYGIFVFPAYTILELFHAQWLGVRPSELFRRTLWLALAVALAAFLVSPYLAHMQFLLAQTTDRGGGNLDYATAHEFTWDDTLGSLLFPPAAQTEGWIYQGVITVFFALYFFVAGAPQVSESRTREKMGWWYHSYVRLLLALWVVSIWSITHVRTSNLFRFCFDYLPGFSSLRVWGRFQVVLVPALCLFSALGAHALEQRFFSESTRSPIPRPVQGWFQLLFIVALVIGVQLWISGQPYDGYWIGYQNRFLGSEGIFLEHGWVAVSVLVVSLMTAAWAHKGKVWVRWLFALCVVGISAWEVSPWIVDIWTFPTPGPVTPRTPLPVTKILKRGFKTRRTEYSGLPLGEVHAYGTMPNWYFDRHGKFFSVWEPKDKVGVHELLGAHSKKRFYFTTDVQGVTPSRLVEENRAWKGKIKVTSYRPERIEVSVEAEVPGHLIFLDNWDPAWVGVVNGKIVPLELFFGTFKGLRVPAGQVAVKFKYMPYHVLGLWPRWSAVTLPLSFPSPIETEAAEGRVSAATSGASNNS